MNTYSALSLTLCHPDVRPGRSPDERTCPSKPRRRRKDLPTAYAYIFATICCLLLTACSSNTVKEGSEPQYTSAFVRQPRNVARINIGDYTPAPERVTTMAQIKLPLSETFDLMAHRIPEWFSDIQDVKFYKDGKQIEPVEISPPAVRKSKFKGDLLVEDIPIYIAKRVIGYQTNKKDSEASLPIEDHLGLMLFEADGQGGTLVTWMQFYHIDSIILYPFISPAYRYGMENALQGLVEKHGGTLVEPAN